MTLGVAAAHVGAHSISPVTAPNLGGGAYNGEILLLLISSAGLIFIDNARSGKGQTGQQYIALGIAGFILLFLGQFAPEIAFAFTLLIFVGIIFNSPNGIPFVSEGSSTTTGTTSKGSTSAPK